MWDPPLEYYTERGREIPSPTYIPGENFDPYDEDDVAAVKLAMENSMHEQMEDMRRRLAYYEGSDN